MNKNEFRFGEGKISGSLSLLLALLSLAGVICFHFPEYTTTPELRKQYDVDLLRMALRGAMFLAALLGSLTFFLSKGRRLGFAGIVITILAQVLGGATVEVGEFNQSKISFGLDWLVLDLLSSTLIFIFLEKIWPLDKNQIVLRSEWRHDLVYFSFNHLAIGYFLLVVTKFSTTIFGWAVSSDIQTWVRSTPFIAQFCMAIFVADFMQYWTHRALHEVPFLWKIHSVHHSPAVMDWLSGSRLHVCEILATRCFVFLPIFLLGFSEDAINAYVVFVGFQAVLNHANVNVTLGPLRHIFVTPHFHHWHHASDSEAIDKNYAAHIPVLDRMFGTYFNADGRWPKSYGVVGKELPKGIVRQHLYPFRRSKDRDERAG